MLNEKSYLRIKLGGFKPEKMSELERWGKLNDKKVPKVTILIGTPEGNEHFTYCCSVWIHKGVELLLLSLE